MNTRPVDWSKPAYRRVSVRRGDQLMMLCWLCGTRIRAGDSYHMGPRNRSGIHAACKGKVSQ